MGRKQLSLFDYDGATELHSEIMYAFPILKDGGGYELLRVSGSGARSALHVIPQPAQGYTVPYLKEVVRQAKVYIRPLQRDLQLIPDVTSVSDLVMISMYTVVYVGNCQCACMHRKVTILLVCLSVCYHSNTNIVRSFVCFNIDRLIKGL